MTKQIQGQDKMKETSGKFKLDKFKTTTCL